MMKLVGNQELCKILGTGNLESFTEEVLKKNINIVYPAKNITIHKNYFGDLIALVIS